MINPKSILRKTPILEKGMCKTTTTNKEWLKKKKVDITSAEICKQCGDAAMLVHEKYPEGQPDRNKFPNEYNEYGDYKRDTMLSCRFYNYDVCNYIDIDLKDNEHIKPSEFDKRVRIVSTILGAVYIEKSVSGGRHIIVQTNPIEGEHTKWEWPQSIVDEFLNMEIVIDTAAIGSKRLLYWTGDIIWENDPSNIKTIERVINDKKTHVSTKKTTTNNQTEASPITEVFIINDEEATDEQLSRLKNRLENDILPRFNKPLSHNKQFPFLGAVQAMGYDDTTIVWNKVREAVDHTNTPSRHNDCYDLTTLYNWLFPTTTEKTAARLCDYDYVIHTTDKYLSTETYRQIVDMPEKVIVQKPLGYGMTRKILENLFRWRQIVIIPYLSIVSDKVREMNKLMKAGKIERGIIMDGSDDYDIVEGIKSLGNKPWTIICTPEKLKKREVIEAIQGSGIKVIADEIHTLHTTEYYRNMSIILHDLKSVLTLAITATPIPDLLINGERQGFSDIKQVRIDNGWRTNMNVVNVGKMRKVKSTLLRSARYMIDKWIKENKKTIIHLHIKYLSEAYKILGDMDASKIRVYCSYDKEGDNDYKLKKWGWTRTKENDLWDVEGYIYVITEYGQQGKNGAYNDGVSGKRYMGLSIVQNALGTVQSIGRVRDTNRDGKGGYTDFYWLIKESGKREFNHYSKDSAAQYFKMSKHVKVKNSYEYFNYLILDNVNNIRNDYFNSIGINVVEKGLDDDIKAEVLIDILEHIQLTGDNAEYNPAEKINITLYGNDEAFEKMLKTVSNEGDKNIWEYCHHQNQQKAFLEYISDCKKDGKKLTFECVKDFYYKTHKGLERIERYINKLANGKKTVDTKTLSDCLQCDVKVVNDFMKSLMKSYANEVDGGYKSYKRFKFNGYAVNWDKIMSLSRKETQPLIDMIENVPIEFKSEATLKSEATVDNLFNDNDEQLIDNKKEYKKQADKQYYTETIKLKFRGGYKKFFTDYEKRKKQYKDIKATKKEQSEIELGMAEKMKIQLKIREFFDANMANQ